MRSILIFVALFVLFYMTRLAYALECDLCETFFTFAERFIEQNSTESYIQEKLEGICIHDVPHTFENVCSAVVSYLPKVVDSLVSKFGPEKICQVLRLC